MSSLYFTRVFARKNTHKSIKSNVSDTHGRRDRDFWVEATQNAIGIIDFGYTWNNFMTFSDCWVLNRA